MSCIPRPPGTLFLRMTRLLFADETVSAVFLPAVADFQDELRQASFGHLLYFVTRCRWYWALTVLLILAPFSVTNLPTADRYASTGTTNRDSPCQLFGMSLLAGASGWLFVMAPRCGQEFMMATLLGGVVFACGMRVWNDYHPGVCAISTRVAALQ